MRLTTKIFVLLAVVAVSLFVINAGNSARADDIPAGTDDVIISLSTTFDLNPTQSNQVVLTGTMRVVRQAQTGTNPIQCEIVAMHLGGTFGGIPIVVTAGSQNGITPSFCTITEEVGPTFVLFEFLGQVFLEVKAGGSVVARNCDNTAIIFGSLLPSVPIPSGPPGVSFGPTGAITGVGVALCDPQGTQLGSFGAGGFSGSGQNVPPPGPPAVGGVVGLLAEDGTPPGSESSSPASAMTLLLLSAAFVTVVALATGGWYFRRRLLP